MRATSQAEAETDAEGDNVIQGKAYVTRDNIDTDQIIPAEWLMLVPSKVRQKPNTKKKKRKQKKNTEVDDV